MPIKDAIKKGINGNIRLYFGDQPHPEVEETLAKGFPVHKRTTGGNEAPSGSSLYVPATGASFLARKCNKSMLAAARDIQAHAYKMGGNAIINIESFHQNNQSFRSNDEFECYSEKGWVGVMLRGDIVRLKE
jgi:hypothetical protein